MPQFQWPQSDVVTPRGFANWTGLQWSPPDVTSRSDVRREWIPNLMSSKGRPCTVRPNASWVMVTWDPLPQIGIILLMKFKVEKPLTQNIQRWMNSLDKRHPLQFPILKAKVQPVHKKVFSHNIFATHVPESFSHYTPDLDFVYNTPSQQFI